MQNRINETDDDDVLNSMFTEQDAIFKFIKEIIMEVVDKSVSVIPIIIKTEKPDEPIELPVSALLTIKIEVPEKNKPTISYTKKGTVKRIYTKKAKK